VPTRERIRAETGKGEERGSGRQEERCQVPFSVAEPKDYVPWLNHPQPKEEIENIRYAIKRSRPYGSEPWVSKAVAQFGLENTVRNPWRPRKGT
jgi:hypothetical protein